jgi:hypothetical protein
MGRQRNARRSGGRAPQVPAGQSDRRPEEAPRSPSLEAALFLLIVPAQLAFFSQSRDAFLDAKILSLTGGTLLLFVTVPVTEPGRPPT